MTLSVHNELENFVSIDQNNIWTLVKNDLKNTCGLYAFNAWLKNICFVERSDSELVLSAPGTFIRDWVVTHYMQDIREAWQKITNHTVQIIDIIAKNTVSIEHPVNENISFSKPETTLDSRFRFNNFVLGIPNNNAFLSAQKFLSSDLNPLFIYGNIGCGKTHLLQALGWELHNQCEKIIYMSAERFMCDFVRAIRSNSVMDFKDRIRSVDVFLVDDIQFLIGKESTQEEFLHTFNILVEQGCKIAMVADRVPSELRGLGARVCSRISAGLIANIGHPDFQMRLGIIKEKLRNKEHLIAKDTMEMIALKISGSVRELEGAINRLLLSNSDNIIDCNHAHNILSDFFIGTSCITICAIKRAVSQVFGCSIAQIEGTSRIKSIVIARQFAMYISRIHCNYSFNEVAQAFGNKDHTTVMYAVKKISDMMQGENFCFAHQYNTIKNLLGL